MSNIARLALSFSIFFILCFALAGVFEYVNLTVVAATTIPAGPPVTLGQFVGELWKIFPPILYCSLLLGLSYSARRRINPFVAILSVFVLAAIAVLGVSLGFRNLKTGPVDAVLGSGGETKTLGSAGLILSRWDVTTVLLGDPGRSGGSRVLSIPGRPLIYQEAPPGPGSTVPLFQNRRNALVQSLLVDSALAAGELETRLNRGLFPFALYAGAVMLLLSSLRFVLSLSVWPLANLFCGALVFRGFLTLQTFVDSRSVQTFILAFFDNRIDGALLSPIIFIGLALLILLYTFLANLAQGPSRQGAGTPRRRRREGPARQKQRRRQPNG
jgi:hypothetical protein